MHVEFAVDAFHVPTRCIVRDAQLARDGRHRVPFEQEVEDLAFACR